MKSWNNQHTEKCSDLKLTIKKIFTKQTQNTNHHKHQKVKYYWHLRSSVMTLPSHFPMINVTVILNCNAINSFDHFESCINGNTYYALFFTWILLLSIMFEIHLLYVCLCVCTVVVLYSYNFKYSTLWWPLLVWQSTVHGNLNWFLAIKKEVSIETAEIVPYKYVQFSFDKGIKVIQWRRNSFYNKWC